MENSKSIKVALGNGWFGEFEYIVIIAGGRDFNDYDMLDEKLNFYFQNVPMEKVLIIGGGAKGADKLGKDWAKENIIEYKTFHADWNKYGKAAGPKRNTEMAKIATHLIAFNTGGRGTADMLRQANDFKLKIRDIKIL